MGHGGFTPFCSFRIIIHDVLCILANSGRYVANDTKVYRIQAGAVGKTYPVDNQQENQYEFELFLSCVILLYNSRV